MATDLVRKDFSNDPLFLSFGKVCLHHHPAASLRNNRKRPEIEGSLFFLTSTGLHSLHLSLLDNGTSSNPNINVSWIYLFATKGMNLNLPLKSDD